MPGPYEFPSLDSCHRRFLWINEEVDLVLHPVVGLVIQVQNAEKLSRAFCLETLDPFLGVSKLGPCLTAIETVQALVRKLRTKYKLRQMKNTAVYDMGETFQATAGFQDSNILQKAMKMALRCNLSVNAHISGFKL